MLEDLQILGPNQSDCCYSQYKIQVQWVACRVLSAAFIICEQNGQRSTLATEPGLRPCPVNEADKFASRNEYICCTSYCDPDKFHCDISGGSTPS